MLKAAFPVVAGAMATIILCHSAVASERDCVDAACPVITIEGDAPSRLPDGRPSPFRGVADPSIRRDPVSETLWMAYSWPNVGGGGSGSGRQGMSPRVDVHLARSLDKGRTWRFVKTLWSPAPMVGPNGDPGHLSFEVASLLPVRRADGVTTWYGARLSYFIPENGGFRRRPTDSFHILVSAASSAEELAQAPSDRLGGAATGAAWQARINLAGLSAETRHCSIWNEPALYHDGQELFLALSCMAFNGKTPDLPRSDLVLFATRAEGLPNQWAWRHAGKLAGHEEARDLGGLRLTQVEFAKARDGALLALVTPDTWNEEAQDFVHQGCRAVETERLPSGGFRLARRAAGGLKVRASVMASDAGPAGTAACSYDPASETGIVMGKRVKNGSGFNAARHGGAELSVTLHATGVHP